MTAQSVETLGFDSYLAERGITAGDYDGLPDEKRRYLREAWQYEYPGASFSEPVARVSYGQPQPRSDIGRILAWVSPVCLVAAVLSVGLRCSPGPTTAASVASTPEPASPQALVHSATSSTPAQASPEWQLVGRVNGTGKLKSDVFVVSGPKWRIAWMTRAVPGTKPGEFLVVVRRADGSAVGPAAHTTGENEGETVLRGAGTYYLEASSAQRYLLRAYDYR